MKWVTILTNGEMCGITKELFQFTLISTIEEATIAQSVSFSGWIDSRSPLIAINY